MTIEAFDAVKLLRELYHSDPTCRVIADSADHSSTLVFEVCQEVLTRLAADKARLAKVVEEMLVALPPETSFRGVEGQAPFDAGRRMPWSHDRRRAAMDRTPFSTSPGARRVSWRAWMGWTGVSRWDRARRSCRKAHQVARHHAAGLASASG